MRLFSNIHSIKVLHAFHTRSYSQFLDITRSGKINFLVRPMRDEIITQKAQCIMRLVANSYNRGKATKALRNHTPLYNVNPRPPHPSASSPTGWTKRFSLFLYSTFLRVTIVTLLKQAKFLRLESRIILPLQATLATHSQTGQYWVRQPGRAIRTIYL